MDTETLGWSPWLWQTPAKARPARRAFAWFGSTTERSVVGVLTPLMVTLPLAWQTTMP